MANAWNGMTHTNIARAGFSAFLRKLSPLGMFATDLSGDLAEQGTVVNTRIVPASAAAVDLLTNDTASGNREHSNIIKDVTTTQVAVTLNQQPITGFTLSDVEAAQIGAGVWADTQSRLLETKAYAVANYILNYCLNLCVSGTFTNTVAFTGAASSFDMDDVVDMAEAAMQLGWDNATPTYLALDTAYWAALKKDSAIQDLSASGIGVVRDGVLNKLDMFSVLPVPAIRSASTMYDASAYGRGFMCKPSALAVAMRALKAQSSDRLDAFEVMTDPVTGATLVYRSYYDPQYARQMCTYESYFGAASAQVTALSLIKSQ